MIKMINLSWFVLISFLMVMVSTRLISKNGVPEDLNGILKAASVAMNVPSVSRGSIFIISDESASAGISKIFSQVRLSTGLGYYKVVTTDPSSNKSLQQMNDLIQQGTALRRITWDMSIVVISSDIFFLPLVAESCMKGRLLSSNTKLIVVTQIPFENLRALMTSHWTFSMMNTLFINVEDTAPKVSFYGAPVNVTALDYKPVWYTIQELSSNGKSVDKLTGMDYLLLETAANTLNFTINLLPVSSWAECLQRTSERESFITPAYHAILVDRLKRFDYTYGFTYVRISFSMAKPQITPNWLSLYFPLTNEVWASTLAAVLVTPVIVFLMMKPKFLEDEVRQKSFGWTILTMFGSLLGQPMSDILLMRNASRVVMASWLLLAFIIGTVYRGNLTAFLTLPKYPPRIETLNDLATSAERITMEPWGRDYKQSFKQSGIGVMEKIADLMNVGPSLKDGLWHSLHSKQAQFDTYHSLLVAISEQFTFGDGTSRFYIGRETVLPGLSGWPIPHDAPFRQDLDWCILASIEAGLYDYWTEEMLSLTRQETRRKKREYQKLLDQGLSSAEDAEATGDLIDNIGQDNKIALTLQHMQGPLMLYLIGVCLATIVFETEKACFGK